MFRRRAAQTRTSGHVVRTSTLTLQYRGLEHAVPLRLSNDAIAMLVLEATVREVSLGQLLGMLIEAAMAQDVSRVLDKKPLDQA